MQNHLNQLNNAQREAVLASEGPSLVIAGAGSGKTRVLTLRIAYLLSQGVPPWTILALTFTNKAAHEMKERIGTIVGENMAHQLWMGTFHSVFARILRIESEKLGYPSNFTIYDTSDSKSLIKSIIREMKLADKEYKPGLVLSKISAAKNDLVMPAAYARDQHRMMADRAGNVSMVYEIYQRYARECRKAGAMDFDDLLLNTNILFRDFPEVLETYQKKFRYVLVDEYQDTNFSQYLIIRKLAEKHNNVCVVGDDAQSIYSFRGAKIENILNFRNDYPDYKLFKLEQNYRSTQTIVNAANSIISNNKGQIKKVVFSEKEMGSKIKILSAISDTEEGFLVVNDIINRRMQENSSFADFAILYRTNAQSRIFEEVMRKNNIPYVIYGGLSFYQRKEIKDLLAYLRLAINPKDGEALKRIINYPGRGIGQTTMARLQNIASENDVTIWDVLNHPAKQKFGFNAGIVRRLDNFVALIANFIHQVPNMSAYDLTSEIVAQSGILKDLLQDKSVEGQTRVENIDELINGVREFSEERREAGEEDTLVHFLEEVSLLTDQDMAANEDVEKVTLMTIHSAKGLEFPNVYLVGVEEGLFPSSMSIHSEQSLEEERRLFYVAVTRAEKNVVLSYSRNRFKYGEHTYATPSRFLNELDTEFLENPNALESVKGLDDYRRPRQFQPKRGFAASGNTLRGRTNFKYQSRVEKSETSKPLFGNRTLDNSYGIKIGSLVEHARFGQGEVIALEGDTPDVKATVSFKNAGEKQLLLKFAKLKILE